MRAVLLLVLVVMAGCSQPTAPDQADTSGTASSTSTTTTSIQPAPTTSPVANATAPVEPAINSTANETAEPTETRWSFFDCKFVRASSYMDHEWAAAHVPEGEEPTQTTSLLAPLMLHWADCKASSPNNLTYYEHAGYFMAGIPLRWLNSENGTDGELPMYITDLVMQPAALAAMFNASGYPAIAGNITITDLSADMKSATSSASAALPALAQQSQEKGFRAVWGGRGEPFRTVFTNDGATLGPSVFQSSGLFIEGGFIPGVSNTGTAQKGTSDIYGE